MHSSIDDTMTAIELTPEARTLRDDAAPHARNHADKTQFLNNYKTKIDALLNLPDRRVPIHRLKETAIPLCTKQISLGSYI